MECVAVIFSYFQIYTIRNINKKKVIFIIIIVTRKAKVTAIVIIEKLVLHPSSLGLVPHGIMLMCRGHIYMASIIALELEHCA